jgi:hypothetical protein
LVLVGSLAHPRILVLSNSLKWKSRERGDQFLRIIRWGDKKKKIIKGGDKEKRKNQKDTHRRFCRHQNCILVAAALLR